MRAALSDVLSGVKADYADVRVEEIERSSVVFRGRDLEDVSRNFDIGGCLRIFKNGNWTTACFNQLEGGLAELTEDTEKLAELMAPNDEEVFALPPADELVTVPRELDPRNVSLERKVKLVEHYNSILRREPRIADTSAAYADTFLRSYFYSTENRYICQERVYTGVRVSAVARDGTNVQDYGKSFGKTQGFETLVGLEPEVEQVARTATNLLAAEKVSSGRYTVVIDPLLAGVFAHEAFGHLSESDFIYQNERMQELMRIGTRYGIDELTIVDDGSIPGERGTIAYDDEGAPGRRNYLIKDGRIHGHLHSRQTAAKMKEDPTGNARAINYRFAPIVRMTNTYIEPRGTSLDQMLQGIDRGLYVVGARGGMTELESFTFSSQYAYAIENGKLTDKMIRDVILSGNVFETLKNIDAVGNDLVIHGGLGGCGKGGQFPLPTGTGGPHVRIRNVVIGGK
jgi:TldD protein